MHAHVQERETERDREGEKGRDSCCFLKIVKIAIGVEVIYMLESIHLKKSHFMLSISSWASINL